ncbi:MAG TPA: hypothetical protein VLA49_16750 [Anaerolineales bacterium]|nr:hypothetical protein [Anaerolineales bacterium]
MKLIDSDQSTSALSRSTGLGLFLLSAATLTFEISLTRLFSVAQFYHFAFMIVSIALLGFGASGTVLALLPQPQAIKANKWLSWLALGCGSSMLAAYLLTNWLPFDSFSVAWDRRQLLVLILHYLALACPFFFSGLSVGLLLAVHASQAGHTYALNLLGSAIGCLLALAVPNFLGGEGTVTLSAALAGLAGLLWAGKKGEYDRNATPRNTAKWLYAWILGAFRLLLYLCLLAFSLIDIGLRLSHQDGLSSMALRLSPYKGLSYALQYPAAQVTFQGWNAYSRVDVVRSAGIRSLPGLSYRYLQTPPPQDGVLVDGDELTPSVRAGADLSFSAYMPAALAYQLHPQASALILEPRAGLDILVALTEGAAEITAVELNPLIVKSAGYIYHLPGVQLVQLNGRSFMRRSQEKYDVIVLALTNAYHPIRSGAYSLAEEYRYTVEAFQDALADLHPGGFLVVTRWLQMPPSEFLRTFAIGITALEQLGMEPGQMIVALRSYNTGTIYMKNGSFTPGELQIMREFAASRAFDLVYAPGLRQQEANLFNILPDDSYYASFNTLLLAQDRQEFYRQYPYDVSPSVDDHPFFGHYFKWSQARQVFAEFGKTWQPFGGAGYFVILAVLGLAVLLSTILVLLPAAAFHRRRITNAQSRMTRPGSLAPLFYFGLIGLAFLLVEIPLIQTFILYLGQPAYAVTSVLFSLLLFSAFGSQLSQGISERLALLLLVLVVLAFPWVGSLVFTRTLGLPLISRLGLTSTLLAPAGFLMGIAFPAGISRLTEHGQTELIPWVWGVNGAASVVSAVLAALLALSFGFNFVLRLGAVCYAGAWLTAWLWARQNLRQSRPR